MAADIKTACKLKDVVMGDFFFAFNVWFKLVRIVKEDYIVKPQTTQGPFNAYQEYQMKEDNIVYYIKSITNTVPDTLEEIEKYWD